MLNYMIDQFQDHLSQIDFRKFEYGESNLCERLKLIHDKRVNRLKEALAA